MWQGDDRGEEVVAVSRGTDEGLERCRLYGCQHEAREHGFDDGAARCWRCVGDHAWHSFTRRDRTADERRRDQATAARMRKRRTWNGPREGRR